MVTSLAVQRIRLGTLVAFGVATLTLVASPAPAPAAAPEEEPTGAPTAEPTGEPPEGEEEVAAAGACAVTGYVVESSEELAELRSALQSETVHQVEGFPLDREDTWVLPDGGMPVVVVDSTEPLPGGSVDMAMGGSTFNIASQEFDEQEAPDRYVTNVSMPHLGPTVRAIGLEVRSGECGAAAAIEVDRSLLSTVVGAAGVGLTVLFGLLTVLVGRLRKGGWLRRFLFAAPLGLVAGIGQAVVLYEAGVISPFTTFPWWLPVAGVGLAALLPVTRWRQRERVLPAGSAVPWPAPTTTSLGGWQPIAGYVRTAVAEVHRATRGEERALVKLAPAQRAGEPGTRLRLEREAETSSGVDHPNLVRLRETVRGEGPPVLVFDDVDGPPLREVAGMSGPQAVTVALGVLGGLGVLHARGLVHREVGPDNVWLSTDGRVVLANLELACAGVEHTVAPEGTSAPYASPEQRAGQSLDGRSDLYACAAMLRELSSEPVPPAVAELLERALADEPDGRPPSAEEFAAQLRQAAYEGYGPDWTGRGALAGALAAHGAIGAAAAGWGAAGAGTVGAASGGAASGGAAAGTAATGGATGSAAFGAAGAGAAPAAATAAPSTPAAGAVGASSGKVGMLANVGAACVVGAVLGVVAVVVDPQPAEAQEPVITPEQARVIFERTMAEGFDDEFTHFHEDAESDFGFLVDVDDSVAGGPLTEIVVGVPAEQFGYPAWFVASALIPYGGGEVSLFARFEREATAEPWLMVRLDWSTTRLLPSPLLDGDWLAPPPDEGDLLADPENLPERYRDWLVRADETREVGEDDLLALREDFGGMLIIIGSEEQFFSGDDLDRVSAEHSIELGEVRTDLIPLSDGTVHVVFTAVVHRTLYNRPDLTSGSCDDFYLFFTEGDPPGEFRTLERDLVVSVDGWIPIVDAVPQPEPTPTPEPTDAPDEQEEEEEEAASPLRLAPVDPSVVTIEDWRFTSENEGGEPC